MKNTTETGMKKPAGKLRSGLILMSFTVLLAFGSSFGQEPFIGEIRIFAGNYAPRGWALCNGQLLPINQNAALYSILGVTYGGDGRTTFGLPDLRGRVPMHAGNGNGLTNRPLGQKSGSEETTIAVANLPAHSHTAVSHADSNVAVSDSPKGAVPARNAASTPQFSSEENAELKSGAVTIEETGGGQPVSTMQPFLVLNYIIALQGIFPPRN